MARSTQGRRSPRRSACSRTSKEGDYLQAPGRRQARTRLKLQYDELNRKYNHPWHRLHWNGLCGKDSSKAEYGQLWCEKCKRAWAWTNRVQHLPKNPRSELQRRGAHEGRHEEPSWLLEATAFHPEAQRQGAGEERPREHGRQGIG